MSVFAKILMNQPCKKCGNTTATILVSEQLVCKFSKCRFCGMAFTTGTPDFSSYAGTVVERTIEFLTLISPLVVEDADVEQDGNDEEKITLIDI